MLVVTDQPVVISEWYMVYDWFDGLNDTEPNRTSPADTRCDCELVLCVGLH